MSLGKTVAELKWTMGVDEFDGWRAYFKLKEDAMQREIVDAHKKQRDMRQLEIDALLIAKNQRREIEHGK